MRLDKFLANAGVGTRSEVKNLIKLGVVLVNKELIQDSGFDVNPERDEVLVDESPIDYQEYVYLMLNKPKGYVSAREDRKDPTAFSLIQGYEHRDLHLVGRLDKDTTGLLIFTDNGQLTHHLTSPKHDVGKIYHVTLDQPMDKKLIPVFKAGFSLGEKEMVKAAEVHLLPNDHQVALTIYEGKFHQVKRMFAKFGYQVINLHREAVGELTLGTLKEGEFRELTAAEVAKLKSL
jgi:16S rRNA pseudouridine516 synthase